MILDFEDLEKLWEHAFKELDVDVKEHNVLITEPPHAPEERRRKKCEIMFETF